MINKTQMFWGAIVGLVTPPIAFVLWVFSFSNYGISHAINLVEQGGLYSEVISLSAIANMIVFYLFLNRKKVYAARGVLLATIFLALIVLATKIF